MNIGSSPALIEQRVQTLPVELTLLSVSTLTIMAGATIAPSLPAMQAHFSEVDNAAYLVRLTLTMPALFIAIGAPVVGLIIDRFGRKPLLLIALIIYGLAGSSGVWLNSLHHLLIGRALLGISVAGIMTTATTLIADYYAGAARGQFLGLQSAFMSLGGVVFLTVGGFVADLHWRLPFVIYLLSLLLLPCVLFWLPEPKRLTATANTATGEVSAVPTPWNLVLLTYGVAVLTQIVFYLIPVQLPFYLQSLVNANASQSGLAIAISTLFAAIGSLQYRRIKARFSFMAIYTIAFLNMAVGYGLISLAQGFPVVLLGLAIAGSGLGLLMPNMNLCLTSITPDLLRGRILSGITTFFFLGQFLSPFFSQPLSQWVGLGATYGIAGVVMLGMAVIAGSVTMRWR